MIREWKKMWVTAFISAGTRAAFCDSYRASASFMRESSKIQAAGVDKLCGLVVIITHGDAVSLGYEPGNVVLGSFRGRLVR